MKNSINCHGRLLSLQHPIVMGIININDDSFYKGSRAANIGTVMTLANKMLTEGASILDLGAMTSKPGSKIIPVQDELNVLIPAIRAIKQDFPNAVISADTLHSAVAQQAIDAGADIINDISGGDYDSAMMPFVAKANVPYIMMHMQGLPEDMQLNPSYNDVASDILKYFVHKIKAAYDMGIKDIVIDPGFGFGKSVDHNYELLKKLEVFQLFDLPVLVGLSRKSMIWKQLNITADTALNGTTALHMVALQKGAKILRTHDVKEAIECINLYEKLL